MRTSPSVGAVMVSLSILVCWPMAAPRLSAQSEGAPIDVAIALDVSGTMRGLIDTTRVKLWEIVNDLAEAEPTPQLRVALITFGNQRGSRNTGWVRLETDLTEDLDLVSERLSLLKGRGADELVGRVLKTALEGLSWSEDPQGLKLLFIAGNESADQDPDFSFRELSRQAGDQGIFVSAVYCGTASEVEAESWKELAELAEGGFATIDHRTRVSIVATPIDRQLSEMGDLLNETFIAVGKQGAAAKRARARQDKNARSLGLPVAATRAQTKASLLYSSQSDLLARYRRRDFDPSQAETSELPRQLRGMTPDELILYLDEMLILQDEIRSRIAELGAERRRFVAEQKVRPGLDDSRPFDRAVRRTIREQAEEAGFTFPE